MPAASMCLYRQEGQWTYEVCYKKHVRQFRPVGVSCQLVMYNDIITESVLLMQPSFCQVEGQLTNSPAIAACT